MRRRRVLALPALVALAGCARTAGPTGSAPSSTESDAPEDVVRAYLAALATNDLEVIASYFTPEVGTLLKHGRRRDTVAGISDVTIVETRWDRDGMDPSSIIDYHYAVRVTVRFTARLEHEYALRPGVNLLRFLLVRHDPADPWRIISYVPVDDKTVRPGSLRESS